MFNSYLLLLIFKGQVFILTHSHFEYFLCFDFMALSTMILSVDMFFLFLYILHLYIIILHLMCMSKLYSGVYLSCLTNFSLRRIVGVRRSKRKFMKYTYNVKIGKTTIITTNLSRNKCKSFDFFTEKKTYLLEIVVKFV